jgi:small-conductance mechanosensitive channel
MTGLLVLLTFVLSFLAPATVLAQTDDGATETTGNTESGIEPRSSLEILLEVIEDDQARSALVEDLRAAQQQAAPPVDDQIVETLAPADAVIPPEGMSFGRRIALITQDTAQDIALRAGAVWTQLGQASDAFDGLSGNEAGVLIDALRDLALVIVVTVAVFVALRRAGKAVYARMGATARDSGVVRTIFLFIASALMDALIVIVAWGVGYLIATMLLGDVGSIGIRQTLYLNAFLLVEMAKVVVRLVLSPSAHNLRPLPISDMAARYLTRRVNLMVGLVGYGQLLVVPILNANVSMEAGRAVSALIALTVVGIAIWLVLRNRRPVADWLEGGGQTAARPATTSHGFADPGHDQNLHPADGEPVSGRRKRGLFHALVRNWHLPVMLYLLVMLVLVLIQPGDAAFRSLLNSGQVLVAALVGMTLSGILTRVIVGGVHLPENVNARLPLLERRLNTFVPKALFVLRLVIFALVMIFALNAINIIDLREWMASRIGVQLTGTIFSVAAILMMAFLVWVALTSWVDYRLNPEFGSVATSREQTLLSLLRNAATIALLVVTLMFVLAEIGLDIAPLLASAGVLGLAIGFGAQKMVQDIITGIFIQFENAMNVGDVVTVGGTTGTVERLTIRSVSLRDLAGAFHVIPFSSVDMVTNYVREFGYFVCDMGVAYRENIAEVKQAMLDAFERLRADPDQAALILGDLEWFGINSFGDSAVVVRARIKCVPGSQWGVGRAYNGLLKEIFDDRNIEIPFPHQTIYLGESKQGTTQPIRIAAEDGSIPSTA